MGVTVDMRGVLAANASSPKRASNYRLGDRPTGLQLAAGHFEGYFSPVLVHPRPDTETSSNARHRNNYTGQPYRIPIAIHGGAYPFNFSLTNAPPGMTIGNSLTYSGGKYIRGSNYGIVDWPVSSSGTYTPTVTVTDQNGVSVSVTWTIVVGTSNWNVLDTTAGTNGTGTLASPYNNFGSINNGKPTLIRACTVDMEQKVIPLDQMTKALVAYSGATVTCKQALSQVGANVSGDMFIQGINFTLDVSRNTVPQMFSFTGLSRTVFFENTFDYSNIVWTLTGDFNYSTNPSVIMFTNASSIESSSSNAWYCVIHSNVFKNIIDRDCLLGYSMRFAVVENNGMQNCTMGSVVTGHGFYFKDSCSDITVRANYSIGVTNTQKLVRIDAYSNWYDINRVDISYNSYRYYGSEDGVITNAHTFDSARAPITGRKYYRNTLYASQMVGIYARGMTVGDVVGCNNNVLISTATNTNGVRLDQFQATLNNTNYVAGTTATGIVDASNYLQGAYATANLGTKGAEIA